MNANNGGPAFPATYPCGPSGMTLRDYFAAKVLQGMCSVTGVDFGSVDDVARITYKLADAMLAAREAK